MTICTYDKKRWLNSAVGISQYEINTNNKPKLITIIGELHELDFTCESPGSSISLFEYCKSRINENRKCKIMLEYPDGYEDIDRIGSKIIRDAFNGDTPVRSASIGIDIRYEFLGMMNIQRLYHSKSQIPDNFEKLNEDFIQPFSIKKLNEICGKPTNEITLNYSKILLEKFSNLSEIYNKDVDECILELKWAWSMVMDYHIINKITAKSNTTEFIIIVGKNHLTNLRNILNNADECVTLVDITDSNKTNCVACHGLRKVCL